LAKLLRHAAELAAEQPDRRQVNEAAQTLGAQKPQDHRNDTGEGFSQVLGFGGAGVIHGGVYTSV
jgi:hypothetical protein